MSWITIIAFLMTTEVHGIALRISRSAPKSFNDNATALTSRDTSSMMQVKEGTCNTKACENESASIKRWLKESIDPCDNFYEFTCGNVEFVSGLTYRAYAQASSTTHNQMSQFLSEPLQSIDTKATRLTKSFYQSCVSRSTWDKSVTSSMLDKYGGWPLLDGVNWRSKHFDWMEAKKNMQIDGFYVEAIFELGFDYDFNDRKKNVFFIDQGVYRLNNLLSINIDDIVIDYTIQRVKTARNVIIDEMRQCANFEKQLQKIASTESRETRLVSSIRSTIRQVQIDYPYINWLNFLNGCLKGIKTVNDTDIVLVLNPTYFRKLGSILQTTANRRIGNYFAFSTIIYGASRLHLNGKSVHVSSENCLLSTEESFPDLIGAVYVQNFIKKETKSAALELSENIRQEFVKMLEKVSWLDNETIFTAVDKTNSMDFNIGYCDTHSDNRKLDKRYDGLELPPNASYLQNLLQTNKFQASAVIRTLRQPLSKDDYEAINPLSTTASYWSDTNSVDIPAAVLQGRFFSIDRPPNLNFGAIGSIIGHEITHGFDKSGSQYDRSGNEFNLFQDETQKIFDSKTQCYEKQYSQFVHPSIANLTVNGTWTLNENIADNVGIKVAYAAYQTFVKETRSEQRLPNLNFTANQLFWIAAAQIYCGRTYLLGFRNKLDYEEEHAPNRYRVIGMFRNSNDFSRDFQCKVGSYMNPPKDEKCEFY